MTMNNLEFVNSKDMREHLKKINWQPDAVLSSWLIEKSKNHTLEEKFSAWEELISVCKDTPLPKHNEMRLFEFLKNYIGKTRAHIDEFTTNYNNEAVYSYSVYCEDKGWIRDRIFYSSYENVLRATLEDDDLDSIVSFSIRKDFLDGVKQTETLYLSPSREILKIENSNNLSEEDFKILYEVFDSMFFDVPTPFNKGDIVTETNGTYCTPSYYEQTFVLTSIITNDKENMTKNSDCFGSADMTAHGYFVDSYGELYGDCINNYLDLEYSKGESFTPLLLATSDFVKGKIGLVEIISVATKEAKKNIDD